MCTNMRALELKTEGFTVKSTMKNSVVVGPPAAGAFRERPAKPTVFRKFYERGDFPIALEHDTKGNRIAWKNGIFSHCHSHLPVIFLIVFLIVFIIIICSSIILES
ncbi:hypothetical protein J4Q44_G00221250 [Coregonus suidteri]|uniref:Parkin coregulated gene protein n=1 Tax=Coregonus suidteri TaxID=861788 RepID=A0AAN8L7N3_9TELE